ncbi:MAG: hypothetical protein M3083_21580 [Actinomycetota bacterium]|nr:hypothetical protein [Actinomycetota bacterium]
MTVVDEVGAGEAFVLRRMVLQQRQAGEVPETIVGRAGGQPGDHDIVDGAAVVWSEPVPGQPNWRSLWTTSQVTPFGVGDGSRILVSDGADPIAKDTGSTSPVRTAEEPVMPFTMPLQPFIPYPVHDLWHGRG